MKIFFGRLNSASRSLQNARISASLHRLPEHHRGRHFLTPRRMRNTETHGFGHRGMAQQNFVDLARSDLFSAAIDQFLETAGERQIPVSHPGSPGRPSETSRW